MSNRPVLPEAARKPVTYRCEVRLRRGKTPGIVISRTDCGQPAYGQYRSRCACGRHVRERWACLECATSPGDCSLCWDEGTECAVTITLIRAARDA